MKLIRKRTWQDWSVRPSDWEQNLLDNGFSFCRQHRKAVDYDMHYLELGAPIR